MSQEQVTTYSPDSRCLKDCLCSTPRPPMHQTAMQPSFCKRQLEYTQPSITSPYHLIVGLFSLKCLLSFSHKASVQPSIPRPALSVLILLSLTAGSIDRQRVYKRPISLLCYYNSVFPNLYVIWLWPAKNANHTPSSPLRRGELSLTRRLTTGPLLGL